MRWSLIEVINMKARSIVRAACNSVALLVSVLVLFAGLFAIASAEPPIREPQRRPIPQQQQQQAPQQAPQRGTPVRQNTTFHALPDSQLQIRAVEYDGSVNGKLIVQVKNPSKTSQKFSATGLYFVPQGDADSAPQRLGAVGPMQIANDGNHKEMTELDVAPGATLEVQLDVFCIDSHRSAPGPTNKFDVGAKRMPKELAATIKKSTDQAVESYQKRGVAAPRAAAKSEVQGQVWKSRDDNWVPLDGEGKQEVGKKKK
jgi:hypothetical protein